MTDQRDHVERVLDVAVYAPIGLALTVRDRLPRQFRQRRQAVLNRVQLAKFVGQYVVRHGWAEIEREVRQRRESDEAAGVSVAETVAEAAVEAVLEAVIGSQFEAPAAIVASADQVVAAASNGVAAPSARSLPIGDYESLAAIHVVQRLASLRDDEIEQIRQFEVAHRARRTVLAKIGQLQDARSS